MILCMPSTKQLSLTVLHNIQLTRAEAYDLHAGKEVAAIGVSVPVWICDSYTSEPAKEVFALYVLKNTKKETPVQIMTYGYIVTLPNRAATSLDISDEEWRRLNRDEPAVLEAMYRRLVEEASSKNLLDRKDGGSGRLFYREHNKVKREKNLLTIIHYLTISRAD